MKRGEEQNMNRRKVSGAMLMCAAMMLIAAAPLVQSSEDGTVHEILKDENGPPSTCALDWWIMPDVDGTWHGAVTNYGMRWLIIDVVDESTGDVLIDREMYRYAVWGDEFDTESVHMVAGHTYWIRGTPNGPLWTYVEVEDVFVPDVVPEPPVAAFTLSVDGLTVSVDASPSYDPDGTIVAYDWDWGDGSTDTGMTATHTYVPPLGGVKEFTASSPVLGFEQPHPIIGTCYDTGGNPLADCIVTVTYWEDGTTSYSGSTTSDEDGVYQFDISEFPGDWAAGKYVEVEAVKGPLSGWADGYTTTAFYDVIDVTLEGETPEPFDVTITLTVTDDDGLSTSVSQTVTLTP